MSDKSSSIRRHQITNFKLNSLLEITTAINENLSVVDLLERYKNILTEDLQIGKVIIFKLNNTNWDCILNSGFPEALQKTFDPVKDLPSMTEIVFISGDPHRFSEDVDIIIPVVHKDKPVAFVLIGDIEEELEGISPVIKHLRFIQTLSNIIIVAIENIRLVNESLRQVALKREMELASRMQTMLIPSHNKLPWNDKIHFKAFYHPHYDVGGDYYDVIELGSGEIGFCIADVSGKGISAAILMSNFQANLRALFLQGTDLTVLVKLLNERVLNSANGEKFITLFIARYNLNTKTLEYINAGHNPPLFYDKNKSELMHLQSGCVGMGMLDEIPVINKKTIALNGPTKLLLYTDGLVELIEGDDVGYGYKIIEEKISNENHIEQNIEEIIVQQRIETGNEAIFDDISMLGVEFTGL